MEKQELINEIITFNNDSKLLSLREKYSEASFFEIISKERSETTFSAFLQWLFQGDFTKLSFSSPVVMLLDILASKANVKVLSEDLKTALITRKFHVKSVQVEAEKNVKELASEVIESGELKKEDMLLIASNCQDRVDIFIECDCDYDGKESKIQILIENKVDSTEGGKKNERINLPEEYKKSNQTQRYYIGTHSKSECNNLYQFYVYLTPEKTIIEDLNDKFIHITYQDILDKIIIPILNSSSVSTRSRFFLEEFKNELTFPNPDGDAIHSAIATDLSTQEELSKIFEDYKELIIQSIIATASSNFWYIKKNDSYFDYQPKEELLECYFESKKNEFQINGWISSEGKAKNVKPIKLKETEEWYYYSGKQYPNLQRIVNDGYLCEVDDDVKSLLIAFWDENKKIIRAIIDNISQKGKIQCLVDSISKRDNIRLKYNIYYDGKKLNVDKALNNAETAFAIINQYICTYQQVTLEDLNKTFPPKKVNTYYIAKNGWLNQLFYQYSEDGTYETKNGALVSIKDDKWDFFQDDKHYLKLSDSKLIMLKMWRTSDLNRLIDYVQTLEDFGEKIKVTIAGKDNSN